jgi:hypothetical protein
MWNYRIMKHSDGKNEPWYGIHEVFYDENGKISSWTTNPIETGFSPSELFSSTIMKGRDIWKYRHEILDYDMMPENKVLEPENFIVNTKEASNNNLISLEVKCECGSRKDTMYFDYIDEPDEWNCHDGNLLSVEFIIPDRPFLERVLHAIKYVFGYKKYIGYTSTLISYFSIKKLISYLQGFINKQNDFIIRNKMNKRT